MADKEKKVKSETTDVLAPQDGASIGVEDAGKEVEIPVAEKTLERPVVQMKKGL